MKPTPWAGELEPAGERYILRHGETLYRVTAASASLATVEVLAFIGDPSIWRGEIEAFTETLYRECYGDPDDVVDVPDVADDVAGEQADLEAGDDEAVQPTNASVGRLRLAHGAGS